MKKRLFPVLLAAAMILSMMAGCGSTEASSTKEAAATQATAAATQTAAAPAVSQTAASAAEASASEAEASAETGKITPERTIEYPLVDEPTTLTYWQAWPPFLSAISQPQDAAMFDALETATGVKLEITAVSTETASDDFMLRCSSGDLTDLVQKGASQYTGGGAKAIEDDVLVDMLPLLKQYSANYIAIMDSDPNIYKSVVNDEGQVPALIGMYTDYYYTDQGYWIRQDILDEVGKKVPTTVDELTDVLSAFKDKGLTDGLVVLSEGNCDLLSRAYDAANKLVDGKVTYMGTSDNYKEFLKKMNEYYKAGYINTDFVTYTDSDTKPPEDIIYNDMAGIFNEDVASISGYYNNTTNTKFDLEPMAQIRKDKDSKLNSGFIGTKSSDKYSLSMSTACTDPELAIEYMDYLFSDEGFVLANYGIEGQTYTKVDGKYQFTDLILHNEQFDWQLCQSLYINPGFPCLTDLSIQEMTYNDAQKKAVDTWVNAYDSSDESLPNSNWLSYTTEESQTIADKQSDIETYQEEWRLKFITGQEDIDSNWDTYCSTLEDMGYSDLEAIDQAAYDRYMAK